MGLLLTYVLGVLTVPALVGAMLLAFWLTAPDSDLPAEGIDAPKTADAQQAGAQASPYSGRRTGWLHITRSLGVRPEAADGQTKLTDMVTRGIAKWIQGKRSDSKRSDSKHDAADDSPDFYYVVLDGDTLVMYDGEAMGECRGVIIMSKHRVSLHHRPNVSESQVYSRRTPIRLSPVNGVEAQLCKRQVAEYFIYADRPTDKEDWYFALLWSSLEYGLPDADEDCPDAGCADSAASQAGAAAAGSANGDGSQAPTAPGDGSQAPENARPRLTRKQREQQRLRMRRACMEPDYSGLAAVMQTISKRGGGVREDEWLNAILGRMFIGAYRTEWVRQHFIRKMQTKFDRVQRPVFLERVVVADLDVGDLAPVITDPRLESFGADGQVDMSMYMHYMGGFRLVLNTAVKLGALRLSISLSVVLQSLAGKMLLRFKPAPSNRFWLAFYEMPRISLKLSPVFMQKQVKYALVSQAIEKQIYDMVRLSLVLPNLDDTVFFPTLLEDGGILERSLKEYTDKGLDAAADDDDAGDDVSQLESDSADSKSSSREPQMSEAASGAITGNSSAARHESRSASRLTMTTPLSSVSGTSPGSSHESLARMSPPRRQSSSSISSSSSAQPLASPGRPPSTKSAMSISASLFKRAKNSQAAESAKSWWQNIQQNGITGDSGPKPQNGMSGDSAVKLQNGVAGDSGTRLQTGKDGAGSSLKRHSLPVVTSDDDGNGGLEEPDSRSQSPLAFYGSHISTPPQAASGDAAHSRPQFPRLDDGGSSSSVYNKRSSMIADSLLVRRRPAAGSQSSDVEQPRRRNSRAIE